MEKKFISDLKVNEQLDTFFMLRKKNLRLTKYDKPYLELGFSDKTGDIEGRMWEGAEKFNAVVESGDIVRIRGTVKKFRDDKQLNVDHIEKADDRAYRFEDMVRVVENREGMLAELRARLGVIENKWIRSLADIFLDDADLIGRFMDGAGAKRWHNAYIGGLAEHTMEVIKVVDRVCDFCPEADRDAAVFGAFLHDIGKVYELDHRTLEYTIEGGLIGHIAIGYKMLVEKVKEIEGFPRDLSIRIEHIILSHHGEYEQQSPVLPKTLEATIVYQADELVSQANAVKEILTSQGEEGKAWSNFVSIKNRKYFIRRPEEEDWYMRQDNTHKTGLPEPDEGQKEVEDLFGI